MTKSVRSDARHAGGERRGRGAEHTFVHRVGGRLRRALEALQGIDERFQAIADYSYDWETWVGVDGKPRWINHAVERMTGYTVDECLSMPDYPLALVHADDRERIARHLRRAARGHNGNDVTFRILRRDETLCWAAVSWQAMYDAEWRPLGYRTSVRDITERTLAEDALRRAHAEAERADRAKSAFLAAASHDLRQPVQAIATFLAVLKLTGEDAERQEVIASIEECLHATGELLDSLLDVSRLDAGVLKPDPRAVAVGDLLQRIKTAYASRARDKGLDLRFMTSSAVAHTDPALMSEVIGNFVSNAIRYTERGRILVGCRRRGSKLRIEVWDSGIGIPAEKQAAIFEEFYQIGNPERDRKRGLGLGLAIVDRIARLLESPVEVRSWPGKGSLFAIEVPFAEGPPSDGPRPATAPPTRALAGLFIVAIDDEPMQLRALEALFEHWGCKVVAAASHEAALDRLAGADGHPDLIVADYRLREGVTGAEAIRRVVSALGVDIPGVLLTGDTEPARLAEAKASGYSLLHKPVDLEELRATLAALRPPRLSEGADATD